MNTHERIRIKDIARMAEVSVGTVDRVIHGRSGVSEVSKKRVEEILRQLDYQPNMYASALATNKRYAFFCLLPQHEPGEYWTAVEDGIGHALDTYTDFNIHVHRSYYDPYNYEAFVNASRSILAAQPDGVLLAPTIPHYTLALTAELARRSIPYIYIDSNICEQPALSFFGQDSHRSGHFAARMMLLLSQRADEIVIFRQINRGILGSNQQERREVGFRDYMQQHHPNCRIMELNLHVENGFDDPYMLDHFFAAHPHVHNGITFNSKAYIVGEYLFDRQRTDFNLMGYDLLERNVRCLRQGSIAFLIAQQPERQGFNAVRTLCEHLIFKREVIAENFMPIDLLTKENIDFYKN
ncbi:MAG: LacI family DNA-binding transcriptional regulator [Prevotellaceae bacterium]|jgi:LacI family transcriptional regulator|nr:LacI family DNA-binding transcriptional regulator [Prevotellaceae bacterium]